MAESDKKSGKKSQKNLEKFWDRFSKKDENENLVKRERVPKDEFIKALTKFLTNKHKGQWKDKTNLGANESYIQNITDRIFWTKGIKDDPPGEKELSTCISLESIYHALDVFGCNWPQIFLILWDDFFQDLRAIEFFHGFRAPEEIKKKLKDNKKYLLKYSDQDSKDTEEDTTTTTTKAGLVFCHAQSQNNILHIRHEVIRKAKYPGDDKKKWYWFQKEAKIGKSITRKHSKDTLEDLLKFIIHHNELGTGKVMFKSAYDQPDPK